ncbi:MAG: TylF/MycF/NovP-related O-methyltransferase, partial [Pseudomonadales bacterium]|nr:TylF/MycF/NovP-related O-methyltransferase [Pseudomonadales bacterium]
MVYDQDGLKSIHNHEFCDEPEFVEAYGRGIEAAGVDYNWHWRVHIGLWAARTAVRLNGDFVECGVNAGFLSSAIMRDLDWDQTGKTFYLLDTFYGLEESQVSEVEIQDGIMDKNKELLKNGFYVASAEVVKDNFSEWNNIKIIEGVIPNTLSQIASDAIAFLHIDLNCAPPEVASMKYLWSKIVVGGIVLLDDYAYNGYRHQKVEIDKFARQEGIAIAS